MKQNTPDKETQAAPARRTPGLTYDARRGVIRNAEGYAVANIDGGSSEETDILGTMLASAPDLLTERDALRATVTFPDDCAPAVVTYPDAYRCEDAANRWLAAMLSRWPTAETTLDVLCDEHRRWEPAEDAKCQGCGFYLCGAELANNAAIHGDRLCAGCVEDRLDEHETDCRCDQCQDRADDALVARAGCC